MTLTVQKTKQAKNDSLLEVQINILVNYDKIFDKYLYHLIYILQQK